MEEIFCFVDERLPRNLIETAKKTIHNAGIIYHNTPAIFAGSEPLRGMLGSDFTKAGTIVKTNEYGIQKDTGPILGKIHELLRKEGRRIIFITVDDLTCKSGGRYLNFCFGHALGRITIISMVRFESLKAREQEIVLGGLIMHELGHLYDLASDGRRQNTEYNIGMHCTDRNCVMHQGLSRDEITRNFLGVERHTRLMTDIKLRYYCPLCVGDIEKYFNPPKKVNQNSPLPPLPPRRKAG